MKKHSRFAFGLIFIGIVVFVTIQAASAVVIGGPETISGTITGMDGDGLVIAVSDTETKTVYGMGPASYWADQNVDFPKVGDEVTIEAYIMQRDEFEKFVAASIFVTQDETIILREAVEDSEGNLHLIPLWSKSKRLPTTVTTVLSATAADCSCECDCDCLEKSTCTCDCLDNSTCDCICGPICDCTCDCQDCTGEPMQQYSRKGMTQ
jgi:hypothetical protein